MQKRRESRERPYTYIHMLRYPVGDFELDYQSVASGKPRYRAYAGHVVWRETWKLETWLWEPGLGSSLKHEIVRSA